MTGKKTTRQKITAAARNLFSAYGFGQTSIDDIITAAGITKGAFYHYFKSKESICEEIIDDVKNEYQNIFQSLPKDANPLERLKTVILIILELNSSDQWGNCRLMLRLNCENRLLKTPVKQKLDAFWKWYIGQYRQLITECRDSNLISNKLSAQQQIDLIVSILSGNVWTKAVFDRTLDKEIIEHILERL